MSAGVEIGRLVALIGEAGTLKLLELHGGTWVELPASLHTRSRIARQLGVAAARALHAEYGGVRAYMPLAKRWRAAMYRAQGMSYRQIALRLGCNEPQIYRYLKGAPARQLELPIGAASGDDVMRPRARA